MRFKANECKYKEGDRKLKKQFITGINGNDMITKMITKEQMEIQKTNEIASEQVLNLAERVEAILNSTKENKE